MSRFTGIPSVPEGVAGEWQAKLLGTLKENIELLTGQRGERDLASKAVTKGDVTLRSVPSSVFSGVTARGDGFEITPPNEPTIEVASLEDFVTLINDTRLLAEEVRLLRLTVDALIAQIRR